MKKAVAIAFLALGIIMASPVFADDQSANDPATIALEKVRADKKYITSQNLPLTDSEARGFWPIYEEYQESLFQLNERTVALIKEYADLYNNDAVTDDKAAKLLDQLLAIETDELALKKSLVPKLEKVLPATKVARYIQIENKLRALVKFQLADKIPLIK